MVEDIEVYATELVEDGLGDGVRVYTSADAVYEARTHEDAAVRIYPDRDGWYAKVQYAPDGLEEAYDRFSAVAGEVETAYDASLGTTPKAFMSAIEDDGRIRKKDGRYTLTFQEEPDIRSLVDQPITRGSRLKGMAASMASVAGGGGVVGAAAGAALGIPGGPPAMAAGAAAGAAGVGGMGGVLGFCEAVATGTVSHGNHTWRSPFPTDRWTRFFEKRRRKRYVDDDRLAENTHFERVNRLNALDRELERVESLDLDRHETYKALEESGIEEVHRILMRTQFDALEETGGVTVAGKMDTYVEAAALAAYLLDAEPPEERPSIYTDPDVFREIFGHCTYDDGDEEELFDTGDHLVRQVYDRPEADRTIVEWLEDRYPRVVQREGQERLLEAGDDAG